MCRIVRGGIEGNGCRVAPDASVLHNGNVEVLGRKIYLPVYAAYLAMRV